MSARRPGCHTPRGEATLNGPDQNHYGAAVTDVAHQWTEADLGADKAEVECDRCAHTAYYADLTPADQRRIRRTGAWTNAAWNTSREAWTAAFTH